MLWCFVAVDVFLFSHFAILVRIKSLNSFFFPSLQVSHFGFGFIMLTQFYAMLSFSLSDRLHFISFVFRSLLFLRVLFFLFTTKSYFWALFSKDYVIGMCVCARARARACVQWRLAHCWMIVCWLLTMLAVLRLIILWKTHNICVFFFLLHSRVFVERVKSNKIQQNLDLSLETHFVNVTRNANLRIASNKMQCNEKGKTN